MWCWRRMEKIVWTGRVKKRNTVTQSQRYKAYRKGSKTKELDWSHLAQELPSKTHYWRKSRSKDRSDGADKEGNVSSYGITLSKGEDNEN